MTIIEVLKAARLLITNPDAWIKGTARAVRFHGSPFPASDNQLATCFCAEGAIQEAAAGDIVLARQAQEAVCVAINEPRWLWCFNDSAKTKHEDVLGAFDLAIAGAQ